MKHTKEPWAINGPRVESENEHGWANDGWIIASLEGPDAIANARRIAACVNACKGVPNEQLEMDATAFIDVFNERNALKRQIDEMATTLVEIRDWVNRWTTPGHPVATFAEKALAKVGAGRTAKV